MNRTCRRFFLIPAAIIFLGGMFLTNNAMVVMAEEPTNPDSTLEIPPPPGLQAMPGDSTDSKLLISDDSDDGFLSEFLNFIIGQ